ncbi:MAG TPA: hypothetical protein VLK37_12925 [Solirubrobacterales bacterium]|nr:hypothetical protein [Solirubrobacterales bacterium]
MRRLLALTLVLLALLPASAAAAPPTVAINGTTGVTFTTAQTSGKVNPQGKETAYRFEYITDAQFDKNVVAGLSGFADAAQAGFGFLEASAGQTATPLVTLEGLTSGVSYHLRLLAESEDGLGVATAPDFITVGGQPEEEEPIPCFGDSCQVLPPEPVDPALGTLVAGLGNPKVHYFRYGKHRPHRHHKKHRHRKTRR